MGLLSKEVLALALGSARCPHRAQSDGWCGRLASARRARDCAPRQSSRFFVQSGNSAVCPLLPDAIQLRRSIPAPVKLTPSSSCRSGSRNSPSLAVAAASRKSRTDPMGGFPARLHLPFAQWPELDKVLWGTALAAA